MIPSPLPGYTVADTARKSHHPAPWGSGDRWFVVNEAKKTVVEGHYTEARAAYALAGLNQHELVNGRPAIFNLKEKS